ncbi:MAG: Gfo/Idh/MocA family protein [Pirellulaceae bacterium]
MPKISRRTFVNTSMQGAAALAAGTAAMQTSRRVLARSPNEKVVLGLIGSGGRGRHVAKGMAKLDGVEFKVVCDVEEARGAHGVKELEEIQGSRPKVVLDMREIFDDQDVDGVVIGTPEHWHALATIRACQADQDVYVEKNISATIWEGRKMIEAARKYKKIVQAGFQCRSAPYVHAARDYVASGELGEVLFVKVYGMLPFTYGGYPQNRPADSDPPEGLDWDRWLGPAAERPYNQHVHRQWYGYWDFSGGNASDAIHTLDVARLVLGDPPHPKSVHSVGGRWGHDDGGQMPDVEVVTYEFDRMVMTFENTGFTPYMFKTPPDIRFGDKFPYWPQNSSRIELYGTKRMMYLGRHGGGWQVLEGGSKELDGGGGKQVASEYGIFPDEWHFADFIDAVRTRRAPHGDVGTCHYSASLEHLANLAYRLGGQKLIFDGESETFVDNEEANRRLKPTYRDGYRVPDAV